MQTFWTENGGNKWWTDADLPPGRTGPSIAVPDLFPVVVQVADADPSAVARALRQLAKLVILKRPLPPDLTERTT